MNTNKLQYFIKVADLHSFSDAARGMYVTQSALSQCIASLEAEIGSKLFKRKSVPLSLTHEGEIFYEYALQVLESEKKMNRKLDDIHTCKSGRLTVAITRMRSQHLLPILLPIFQKQYPLFQFQILDNPQQDRVEQVVTGLADFAFISRETRHPHLEYILLSDLEILLSCPPMHPFAAEADGIKNWNDRPPFDLRRLHQERFILSDDPHFNHRAYEIFKEFNFTPNVYTTLRDWRTIHLLSLNNVGFTFAHDSAALADFDSIRGVYFRIDCKAAHHKLYLCYRKDAYLSQAMKDFIDLTKNIVKTIYSFPDEKTNNTFTSFNESIYP